MSEGLRRLDGRRVLLGVSGGIAAYKAAEVCRLLVKAGASVQVMMTSAAQRFVGATTFAALSGKLVATDLFDAQQEEQIGHIALADEADLMLLAPATADLLAKLAHGLADDLVTTVYLAFTGPVLVAPAMNVHMWEHPATQANAAALAARPRHRFVGPAAGEMACGHVGRGRMAEPDQIAEAAAGALSPATLDGRRLLVSAGPTREAIDPVRYLSNRSTGRMGYALAAEAHARGAEVILVSGPTMLAPPAGVDRVSVTSAAEMAAAVHQRADAQDAVIMAAAVADFRPAEVKPTKIKKGAQETSTTLALERTEDILASLGAARSGARPLLVGFAAEAGAELDAAGPTKLAAKGCDLLVANDVRQSDAGFEAETNRVVIFDREGGRQTVDLAHKRTIAAAILERVARGLNGDWQLPAEEIA